MDGWIMVGESSGFLEMLAIGGGGGERKEGLFEG